MYTTAKDVKCSLRDENKCCCQAELDNECGFGLIRAICQMTHMSWFARCTCTKAAGVLKSLGPTLEFAIFALPFES